MEELLSLKWNNHRSTFLHILGVLRDKVSCNSGVCWNIVDFTFRQKSLTEKGPMDYLL